MRRTRRVAGGPFKPSFGLSGAVDFDRSWFCVFGLSGAMKARKLAIMPWGLERFQQSGQTHFVTFCCWRRRHSFAEASARCTLEVALERVRNKFGFCVYGYVVMPEHIHLLVGEPQREPLANAIKSLKQSVSRR